MANNVLESGQVGMEPGRPDQSISSAGAGASTSNSEDAVFEARVRKIAQEVAMTAAQSQKDKRIGRLEHELNDYRPVISKFKELLGNGYTPEQAEREIEFQQIRDAVLAKPKSEQPEQPAGNQVSQATLDAQTIVKSMGLSLEDPEVSLLLGQTRDTSALLAEVGRLLVRRATAPKPSPASIAAPQGGTPPDISPEQLKQNYIKEVIANRGNRSTIKEIQQKYLQQGLDVYSVPFSI